MNSHTVVVIENGVIFKGTLSEFEDNFFTFESKDESNQIKEVREFCKEHDFSLSVENV